MRSRARRQPWCRCRAAGVPRAVWCTRTVSCSRRRGRSAVAMACTFAEATGRRSKRSWPAGIRRRAWRCSSVEGLGVPPVVVAARPARVGHLALAVARSWSNAVTASAGIVAVIGGPLPTGRRRSIEQVIRTTAPMHDGFAGGAFMDTAGACSASTTATAIRGLGVVDPGRHRAEDGRHARRARRAQARLPGPGGAAGEPARGSARRRRPRGRAARRRRDAGGPGRRGRRPGRRHPARLRRPRALVAGGPAGSPDGRPRRADASALRVLRGGTGRRTSPSPSGSVQLDDLCACCSSDSAADRARLRAKLERAFEIAGEFPTPVLGAAARASTADAVSLAPRRGDDDDSAEPLTPREVQVLELLAEGLSNKAIAARLGISDQTVKFHVAAISGKLGASNRTDAVRRAIRRGLVTV